MPTNHELQDETDKKLDHLNAKFVEPNADTVTDNIRELLGLLDRRISRVEDKPEPAGRTSQYVKRAINLLDVVLRRVEETERHPEA